MPTWWIKSTPDSGFEHYEGWVAGAHEDRREVDAGDLLMDGKSEMGILIIGISDSAFPSL